MFKIGHYGLFLGHIEKKSHKSNAFIPQKAGSLSLENKILLCPRQSILRKPEFKFEYPKTVGVINLLMISRKLQVAYYNHKSGHIDRKIGLIVNIIVRRSQNCVTLKSECTNENCNVAQGPWVSHKAYNEPPIILLKIYPILM